MTQVEIDAAASDTRSHLENAVGDMAHTMIEFPSLADDTWEDKVATAKKEDVTDLPGWLADELYNDKDSLSDLMNDHIFDHARGDREVMVLICNAMLNSRPHTALEEAIVELKMRCLELTQQGNEKGGGN